LESFEKSKEKLVPQSDELKHANNN